MILKIKLILSILLILPYSLSAQPDVPDSTIAYFEKIHSHIDSINAELGRTTDALINMVLDTTLDKETRRCAGFALGRVNSEKSIRFLFDNFGLNLVVESHTNDDDFEKEMVSFYALRRWGVANAVIPVLFKELNNEISDSKLIWFHALIKYFYGYDRTKSIIKKQLNSAKDVYLKNLTKLNGYE